MNDHSTASDYPCNGYGNEAAHALGLDLCNGCDAETATRVGGYCDDCAPDAPLLAEVAS